MTCRDHATPTDCCVGCLGRWDRAMAERALAGMYGVEAATLRMAIEEIDGLVDVLVGERRHRAADLDEAAATYAAMRAEISKWYKAAHDGIDDASLEHGVREAGKRDARIAELEAELELEALRYCDHLGEYHDGEVDTDLVPAFRDHLTRCDRCRERLLGLVREHAVLSTSEPR